MEALGVALVVFGPIVAVLVLLAKAIRKLRPPVADTDWRRQGPPRGTMPAGDREPRRPLTPSRAGAVALPVPVDERYDEEPPPVRWIGEAPGRGGEQLAG